MPCLSESKGSDIGAEPPRIKMCGVPPHLPSPRRETPSVVKESKANKTRDHLAGGLCGNYLKYEVHVYLELTWDQKQRLRGKRTRKSPLSGR